MKVLVIAYYFPPCSGPGVLRTERFVRSLLEHGHQVTVLTAEEEVHTRKYGFGVRPTLNAISHPLLKIIRSQVPNFHRVYSWVDHRFIFPFVWIFLYPLVWEIQWVWLFPSYRAAKKELSANEYDLIVTSSMPFSTLFLGAILRKKFSLPWMADLRDPWSFWHLGRWPTRFHYYICRKIERMLLKKTDQIIVVSRAMADKYRRILNITDPQKLITIYHGYDSEEFQVDNHSVFQGEKVTFVFSGNLLSPPAFLITDSLFTKPHVNLKRKWWYEVNETGEEGRHLGYFLHALRQLLNENPNYENKVNALFIGDIHPLNKQLAHKLKLDHSVFFHGYEHDRKELVQLLKSADILLGFMDQPSSSENPLSYIGGKFYEYIGLQKPILVLTDPHQEVVDVIRKGSPYYRTTNPTDIVQIKDTLKDILDNRKSAFKDGERNFLAFTRTEMGEKFVSLAERIAARG